ncbi:MAG: hypothetical protein A2845_01620 [Candidatus Lloydbacteria bacterium RIFCSPHIGHO2_01_FULL_49_22]|uniref:phosphoglycerate mutase (2,3-diphosphoglycerate-dependent) n=1 Tax=Candidatus Lloydbacteria bacterium RIFCSPHIGHO2_01_FULL_49_22 TaxID=1798658 RepID=A0A1G2CXJ9_9BACT|nr:MAG: hypothetical protein A2845_01620 [Candidatus Lloydbacteria bacterium RIFCSPHIGHO2_01_FULL_49_22]OGZ09996.1 MAG: hypothetical protein A3C14_04785 [Candidatus Lloydbacteria bacterium RIFCSPHIGHO2_02_FULL_50_18]
MVNIFIARHGQDVDNRNGILNGHRDLPLTEKGIAEAHQVADLISAAKLHFDAVYTSPLLRASETAAIITTVQGGPMPIKEDLLIERDFGIMTGKKVADISMLCASDILITDMATYFLEPFGAETFPDLLKRSRLLLDKLEKLHPSGNILLVAHGDIGKMLYAEYYHLHWEEVLMQFHFGNCDLLLLSADSPASASHVFQIR